MAKDREKPSTAGEPEQLQRERAKSPPPIKRKGARQDENTANQPQKAELVESEPVAQDDRFPVGDEGSAAGADKTVEEWASEILEPLEAGKANLIESGRRLLEAENALPKEKVTELYSRVNISRRTAQQLKDFYRSLGRADVKNLPNTYRALNYIKKLEHTQVKEAIEHGEVHPGLKAKDAAVLVQRYKSTAHEKKTPDTNLNYKLGQLRRLNTAFQDLKEDDIKSMVENLKETERETLRATIRSIEWYLEAGRPPEDKDAE